MKDGPFHVRRAGEGDHETEQRHGGGRRAVCAGRGEDTFLEEARIRLVGIWR
jgi:hypothetical protein